jgi:hypothetical protein
MMGTAARSVPRLELESGKVLAAALIRKQREARGSFTSEAARCMPPF